MSSLGVSSKRRRDATKRKLKVMGNHNEFLSRIKKTLYYGKLPVTERFSLPVSELAAELFSEVKRGYSLERLDLEEAAVMSRNACVSPCSLVLALLYLERLKTCNPNYLQRVAPSELFLVSMMVASKFLHDDGEVDEVFNDEWASSAGINVKDINNFERDFLQAIDWEVFVSEQAFWKRLCQMEKDIALKEGKRRGWFSYTDLENLLDTVDLAALAHAVLTVSAVCLTSYTASVLTIIGSAFIVSQIPGTPISTRVSSSTSNLPSSPLLQETPIINPADHLQSPALSSVDVLTTSFILASLSSCPLVDDFDLSSGFLCNDDTGTHFHEQYLMNTSDDVIYTHGSSKWSEFVSGWMKYVNWPSWESELCKLHPTCDPFDTKARSQLYVMGHKMYKLDDSLNKSGANSRQVMVETTEALENSQEWITEIHDFLHHTLLERSSQAKFFPLEMATSNY
ncbi:hypothetical protein Cfor_05761 [Coptotermes formosanus]|uniref:Protein CNPPD1 n=1 Tax=Coptotermes formosanus TaxID=36987 RepID=A0A6L2Q0M7_COPFO|nr:hypothetical protein Cfor_05761 [Coptotermes formosanus]